MTAEDEQIDPTAAFELLAHDTRMAAIRVLWEAREPLRFSEIADRAGISDTGNFNYHFGKLVGHFVRKTEDRYTLTRSGRRAITAVVAGDVTEQPTFDSITVEQPCPYCDSNVELDHDGDQLRVLCSSCSGTFEGERETLSDGPDPWGTPNPSGTITRFGFPPAGMRDREPETILDAALVRLLSRVRDMDRGVCPDCGGPVEQRVSICPTHDSDGVCETCGSRFRGVLTTSCETCRNTMAGLLALAVLWDPQVRAFFTDHGYDLLDPSWAVVLAVLGVDERVHSRDPVDYEASWSFDDERLRVCIDDQAMVSDLSRIDL